MTNDLSLRTRLRCDAIATRLRAKMGVRAFDPLPARKLAQWDEMPCDLLTPSDLDALPGDLLAWIHADKQWDGFIKSFEPFAVVTHPDLSPVRFESTVMHEYAHVLLNHPAQHLYIRGGEQAYRDYDKQIEREAAFLGGCLQIPSGGIVWARQRKMAHADIEQHFGASEEMVRWRLNATPQ